MIESIFPSTLFKDKIGGWMALDMELEEPLEWDGVDLVNDSLYSPIQSIGFSLWNVKKVSFRK